MVEGSPTNAALDRDIMMDTLYGWLWLWLWYYIWHLFGLVTIEIQLA